jgi:cytochrome oxidase assembly protein ShyY1
MTRPFAAHALGSNPMGPRIDRPRTDNPRLDNLVSWFAASVLVTAGVIYGLKGTSKNSCSARVVRVSIAMA